MVAQSVRYVTILLIYPSYNDIMHVTFYFDPSCPFSWITSRWLLQISNHRDVTIEWKPFSLALKNNELEQTVGESHRDSLRTLRVLLAIQNQHGIPLIDGYTASGMVRHIMGDPLDDAGLKTILSAHLELPESLIGTADDTAYDEELRATIDEAVAIVGNNVGVPTIAYHLSDGTKQGYFGPVLNELPEQSEGLELWDGLAKLATVKSFYELKRNRPDGDPNTASTARC